jgi:hypothetical protein
MKYKMQMGLGWRQGYSAHRVANSSFNFIIIIIIIILIKAGHAILAILNSTLLFTRASFK